MTIINRGLGVTDYCMTIPNTRIPGGTIFKKSGVYRFYDDVYQLNKPHMVY